MSEALGAVVEVLDDARPLATALRDLSELIRVALSADGAIVTLRAGGEDHRATSGREAEPLVGARFGVVEADGAIALVADPERAPALEGQLRPFALVAGLALAARALRERSGIDALTGLGSRRVFEETLLSEWQRATREGTTLGILLIDVDFFNVYNDRFGHLAGDECLARLAAAALGTLKRAGDKMARFAGERFAVVLPRTPLAGAIYAAERIREAVGALAIPMPLGESDLVTVSVGVAVRSPQHGDDPQALMAAAERHLYHAKAAGRDRVAAESYLSVLDVHPLCPLPAPLSRFVGRGPELATIAQTLREVDLVTLTGPAGIGKTRTAIAAAELVAERFDVVKYLEVRDDDGVAILAKAVAALALDHSSPLDAIAAAAADHPVLLVVDDVESVRGDGSSTLAEIAALPNVRVICAGRFPLGVPGERRIEIGALDDDAAQELLIDRARSAGTALDARADDVAGIVAMLGGSPLAIELAAAHLRSLDAAALAARLRERPQRNDTAGRRATTAALVESIVAALPERHVRLLAAMTLFRAPVTPHAVAAVIDGPDGDDVAALAACTTLADHGLVGVAAYDRVSHFLMLDIVRDVAAARLGTNPDAATIVAAYVRWCHDRVAAAGRKAPMLSIAWLRDIDALVDDVRAALNRAASDPALAVAGAEILASVARYFIVRGRIEEAATFLERFIDVADLPVRVRARLYTARASLALGRGDERTLSALAERAWHLLRDSADDAESPEMATTLNYRGIAARVRGDFVTARGVWQELRALSERLGHRRGEAIADLALADLTLNVDVDAERADDQFARAAIVFSELHDPRNLFLCRLGRVSCAAERGDGHALEGSREVIAAAEAIGDPAFIAPAWLAAGVAADAAGDAAGARDALGRAAPIIRDLRHAQYALELAEGVARVIAGDDPVQAAFLLGTADRRASEHGLPRMPLATRRRDTVVARATAALGAERFAAERERGEAADPDGATEALVALLTAARA